MSIPGESYEEWLARTAPTKAASTVNPRSWDWGVALLLGVFFAWVVFEGGSHGWIGLGIALVLAVEAAAGPGIRKIGTDRDRALRAGTLLVTLVLSGVLIAAAPGALVVMPAVLVLLDLKDDRSILRSAWESRRDRRQGRANGPRSQEDPGPSAG